MKRILPILFLLVFLCGCGRNQESTETTTTQTTQASEVNTYLPQSDIEKQTNGVVRQYKPEQQQIDWIVPFSGGVLAGAVDGETSLLALSGVKGTVMATATVPVELTKDAVWQATTGGLLYYAPEQKQVVLLDGQLKESKRLQLPDTLTGKPAIAPDGSTVFYCVDKTVYAMDTDLMIIRPVRTNTCQDQTLVGCYMNGAVIACNVQDALGKRSMLYFSGEDGRQLHQDQGVQQVYSWGNDYLALRTDGTVDQYIYGELGADPMQLHTKDTAVYGALSLGGVVGQSETAEDIQLSFYNMKKISQITLPAEWKTVMAAADNATGGVWLLTEKGALLHWSHQLSRVTEEEDYSGPVYTAQAPDTEGLAQCADRAEDMEKELGITIRIHERALVSNDDYDITVEYQTEAIRRGLDELETLLKKFPEKFLYKSVARTIRVCIVRNIGGEITSAYHWHDGDPFIILSVGVDMEQAFLDAFSYVLDIHVLGNSAMVDDWETLNPKDFVYGEEKNEQTYLEGESRAFADSRGMKSVTDDRASVFYYAMLENNAQVFQSETMQAKLLLLCQAIRDAWRLKDSAEVFPWEQYLNQSIASVTP